MKAAYLLLFLLFTLPADFLTSNRNLQFESPPASAAEQPVEAPASEPESPITVNLVGDILLDNEVDSAIRKHGIDYPFAGTAGVLKDADVTFGNLETSVSERGKAQVKQYTFRSRPETLQSLVNAGFDGVSVANNHTLDYGLDALRDTLGNLKKYAIGYTGAGENNDEAFAPYIAEVRGKKIAVIGISRVLPYPSWYAGAKKPGLAHGYSMEPMMAYVKKAVAASDYTIVFIHWNKERTDYPEPYARTYAKAFIDAGADAVIGAHSHSLHGAEWYKGKPVFYSLGNFVFTSKADISKTTMIVKLAFSGDSVKAQVTPAKIVDYQPRLMDAAFNKATIAKLNKISYNAAIAADGTVTEKVSKK